MRRSGPDFDQDERIEEEGPVDTDSDEMLEEEGLLDTDSDDILSVGGIDYNEATVQSGADSNVELAPTKGVSPLESNPDSSNPKEMATNQRQNRADDASSKGSTESASSQSSDDLHDFLQWVFGPSGVPSLRLFAYGDFSYNRRFDIYCDLFCRDEQSANLDKERHSNRVQFYRKVTDEDQELWDLLKEHENLITACPIDSLFESRYRP
jgi:hypothetical protein